MTAIPRIQLSQEAVPRAALVVTGRRRIGDRHLVEAAAAHSGGGCLVVRGRGRRSGASEALVSDLLNAGISTVVVASLSALHPSTATALSIVGALLTSGIRLVSLADGWTAKVDPETVVAIASYLSADQQRRASRQGRTVIASVRQTGAKVGRPSRPLPVSPEEARQLVEQLGWRGAGRRVGISPASLRRRLAAAGLLPVTSDGRTA
jgi:DNA invertase Pin-like site-specific DNA recombinase